MPLPTNKLEKLSGRTSATLTPTQEHAIYILYQNNMPIQEVADFFGISYPAVRYRFKRLEDDGVIQKRKLTIEDVLRAEGII